MLEDPFEWAWRLMRPARGANRPQADRGGNACAQPPVPGVRRQPVEGGLECRLPERRPEAAE